MSVVCEGNYLLKEEIKPVPKQAQVDGNRSPQHEISPCFICQRFVCSVEIWFLLNPERTDRVFAWPDGHRWSFRLGHAGESCQLCHNIHGLGCLDNQRLLELEGSCPTLLTLPFHHSLTASGVGYLSSSAPWTFKHPSAADVPWGPKGDSLEQEGPSPSLPQNSKLGLCIPDLHLPFLMPRNKCMHETPGSQYLEVLVLAKNFVQGIPFVKILWILIRKGNP